jgi:hypothetical protein
VLDEIHVAKELIRELHRSCLTVGFEL